MTHTFNHSYRTLLDPVLAVVLFSKSAKTQLVESNAVRQDTDGTTLKNINPGVDLFLFLFHLNQETQWKEKN